METSRSKTIRESSGTTCANYFAKQSLAVVAVATESRSTVTILVRSGRYNVAAQCLPIQASGVGCRDTLGGHPCPVATGGLLIQLFRAWSADSRRRLAHNFFPDRTCELGEAFESFGECGEEEGLSINPVTTTRDTCRDDSFSRPHVEQRTQKQLADKKKRVGGIFHS